MSDPLIDKFQKEAVPLIRKEFKPNRLILFGSRIKENARADSDIDVILVSPFFENIKSVNRMSIVLKKVPFKKHVDYLCYTNEEFNIIQEESGIIQSALKNSLEIEV
ncbi:MAG: nucleotidyltransferase domain-containing protein [Candidatus Methanofastidiosa archaeon]|nr:nucleotidyltransferase domain-containing protein [Candidatus Methanofastidiosa archaeon]